MSKYRRGSHTLTRLTCHVVWVTKYRYKVLQEEIKHRCRELLLQDCETLEIEVLRACLEHRFCNHRILDKMIWLLASKTQAAELSTVFS